MPERDGALVELFGGRVQVPLREEHINMIEVTRLALPQCRKIRRKSSSSNTAAPNEMINGRRVLIASTASTLGAYGQDGVSGYQDYGKEVVLKAVHFYL